MIKAIINIIFLLTCLLLFPFSAVAIPTLGVAPGEPDETTANLSYDGFPIGLDGGTITIWYGSDSGNINYDSDHNDLWLLTTSTAGAGFLFTIGGTTLGFSEEPLYVASYKEPVYGVNLTGDFGNGGFGLEFHDAPWEKLDQTFYSYEFGDGTNKLFYYLTGDLDVGPNGLEIGDWMYAVLEGNSVDDFSPKTTSSMATPEPASMLLLGSGLLGLAAFGRKKFFKKK